MTFVTISRLHFLAHSLPKKYKHPVRTSSFWRHPSSLMKDSMCFRKKATNYYVGYPCGMHKHLEPYGRLPFHKERHQFTPNPHNSYRKVYDINHIINQEWLKVQRAHDMAFMGYKTACTLDNPRASSGVWPPCQLNSIQEPWVQSKVLSQSISPKGASIGSTGNSIISCPGTAMGGSRTRSKILLTTFLRRPASM